MCTCSQFGLPCAWSWRYKRASERSGSPQGQPPMGGQIRRRRWRDPYRTRSSGELCRPCERGRRRKVADTRSTFGHVVFVFDFLAETPESRTGGLDTVRSRVVVAPMSGRPPSTARRELRTSRGGHPFSLWVGALHSWRQRVVTMNQSLKGKRIAVLIATNCEDS